MSTVLEPIIPSKKRLRIIQVEGRESTRKRVSKIKVKYSKRRPSLIYLDFFMNSYENPQYLQEEKIHVI